MFALAITALIYAANCLWPYTETASWGETFIGVISTVLCPPGLLIVPFIDIEPFTISGAFLWLIVGLLNSALYATIGTIIMGVRRKSDGF